MRLSVALLKFGSIIKAQEPSAPNLIVLPGLDHVRGIVDEAFVGLPWINR
jgi:hypothetical protein